MQQDRGGRTFLIGAISGRWSAVSDVDGRTRTFRNAKDHRPATDLALLRDHRMSLLTCESFGISRDLTHKTSK
ncbi:MAG TPA: hypothetical protein VK732_08020 [Verrucomicrobiae bacterium]|nr:hypothetical protein [Verrucomicrobiae bacterium]